MQIPRLGIALLAIAASVWLPWPAAHGAAPEGFVSLFNGKDLDGWTVRQPDNRDWSVVDGVIDICEEHGWDWAYHAFREWDGWSVEHGQDPNDHNRSKTPTDREQLLRSRFEKNPLDRE